MVEMHYKKVTAYIVFALAALALLAFGVAGVGRGANPHFDDVRYFYAAAQTMLNGQSPYTFEAFKLTADAVGVGNGIGVYPYPPHSLLPSVPLTWFPVEVARWLWTIANLCVLGVVALLMGRWYAERTSAAPSESDRLASSAWIPAIVVGNPFAAHLVWTGQTGLFVLGCLLLVWHGLSQGRPLLAGIFLGLASIKPQLSILVILWIAFTGHYRVLLVACLTALAMLLLPLAEVGPRVIAEWWQSALAYQGGMSVSLPYNANLRSLLMGFGLSFASRFGWVLPMLAVVYVAALAYRHRLQPLDRGDVLAALLTASLLLVFGRDYDIAVLAPLVPALWWHCRGDAHAKWIGLTILALMFVPQRLVSQWGVPMLQYWRIALLGVLLTWLTAAMWRRAPHPSTAQPLPQ